MNTFFGKRFEMLVRDEILPNIFERFRFGRWWYKNEEIDLVISDNDMNLILAEVKWKTLSYKKAKTILSLLEKKGRYFEKNNIRYCLVAKKVEDKERLMKDYLIFDLEDIERILRLS